MPFNVPPLSRLIKDGEKDIEIELDVVLLPPFSVERAVNVAVSSLIRDLYDHQTWLKDQIIPTPKSDDETIIETATYEGVLRKQATFATGYAIFNGTGSLSADTELQSNDRIVYRVTTDTVAVGGVITAAVQAADAGYSGNLSAGEPLVLLSPVPGVSSQGLSGTDGIAGGTDIEPIAELLDRLLYFKRNPPAGGALHDYVIWAREMPGVSRAWAWDCWHGAGTVGLAWVYDARPGSIFPTYSDQPVMEAWLFRHTNPATNLDVGKPGGIEVWPMLLTPRVVSMSIRLTPDTVATRSAVSAAITELIRSLSPEKPLLVSALRTAIGSAVGVTDYTVSITTDVTAGAQELIILGTITWLTA